VRRLISMIELVDCDVHPWLQLVMVSVAVSRIVVVPLATEEADKVEPALVVGLDMLEIEMLVVKVGESIMLVDDVRPESGRL
jgi:hypothetical protein